MRAWMIGLWILVVGCDDGKDTGSLVDSGEDTAAVDADGDGYPADVDCDDGDPDVHPGATETWYDGIDQDCAGDDDDDQDADGVLGGDDGSDCDDTDPAVYPGAPELCNGADDDCDTDVDEDAADAIEVYLDADLDGYGAGDVLGTYCEAPEGTAAQDGDCDDGDAARTPFADELCDGVDNDCDGYADDSPVDGATWYPDRDGDGFGDSGAGADACEQPENYVADGSDCDDGDALTYPSAAEVCDLGDNDCDGEVDEGANDPRTYYGDADLDGYGDPTVTTSACGAPAGYVEEGTDCDDADATRSPGAYEACDSLDNDCDGEIDTDSPDAVAYHPDVDGDGFGDADTTRSSCDAVSGWLTDGSDCDDGDAGAFPGAAETCDGDDDDCDGTADESDAVDAATWYIDADADGYGEPSVETDACDRPSGFSASADDCDDTRASVSPAAREGCDGLDNDCDGETDPDDAFDAEEWYLDADTDSYGDAASTATACAAPSGYVGDDADCDDADATVNPGAAEDQDLVDQDCDGYVDEDFVSAGDVIVTEFARQPYAGGSGSALNPQAQWFEVYNASSFDVDLANWYVEEQVGDNFYVSPDAGLVVPAGGYVVLCYDDAYFGDPTDCDYTWGDVSWGTSDDGRPYYDTTYYFDRDDDLVVLYMGGTLMDQVDWEIYDASGDAWPRTAHYSAELDDSAMDATSNDAAAVWCLAGATDKYTATGASSAQTDYGTPGEANGSCD